MEAVAVAVVSVLVVPVTPPLPIEKEGEVVSVDHQATSHESITATTIVKTAITVAVVLKPVYHSHPLV
jgi:hypothetical protein